jgi:hypothetical protein
VESWPIPAAAGTSSAGVLRRQLVVLAIAFSRDGCMPITADLAGTLDSAVVVALDRSGSCCNQGE